MLIIDPVSNIQGIIMSAILILTIGLCPTDLLTRDEPLDPAPTNRLPVVGFVRLNPCLFLTPVPILF